MGSAILSIVSLDTSNAPSINSPPALAAASVNFKSEKSLVRASQLSSFPSPKPKLPKNSSSSPAKIPTTPFLSSLSLCFTASAFFFL